MYPPCGEGVEDTGWVDRMADMLLLSETSEPMGQLPTDREKYGRFKLAGVATSVWFAPVSVSSSLFDSPITWAF